MIGTPESEVVSGSLRSAREHHLDHEILDAAQIRRAIPGAHARPRRSSRCSRRKRASSFLKKRFARTSILPSTTAPMSISMSASRMELVAIGNDRSAGRPASAYETERLILAPGSWAPSYSRSIGCRSKSSRSSCIGSIRAAASAVHAGSIPDLHLGHRRWDSVLRISSGRRRPRESGVLPIEGERGDRDARCVAALHSGACRRRAG